jgi:hypothetical protein
VRYGSFSKKSVIAAWTSCGLTGEPVCSLEWKHDANITRFLTWHDVTGYIEVRLQFLENGDEAGQEAPAVEHDFVRSEGV